MTGARIIFVPGLKPKPPPQQYRQQLLRVLLAGIQRAKPTSAALLAASPERFVVVTWTYLFYGIHRDIALDLEGIERLLTQPEPSEEDLRELAAWRRRLLRIAHRIGDALPLLGRRLAGPATRLLMHDASRYLKDRDGIGTAIRRKVADAIEAAWRDGDEVLLIGHSLGSVIAYDVLWELSHTGEREAAGAGERSRNGARAEAGVAAPTGARGTAPRRVDLFISLGSPLGTYFVQRSLKGAALQGAERYPRNLRRWINFSARADTTALQPRLAPSFGEMVDLGLIESIEDHIGLTNHFRGAIGLNAHEVYGYLAQAAVGATVGEWLERASNDRD